MSLSNQNKKTNINNPVDINQGPTEANQKEIQALRNELFEKTSTIEQALLELKKADIILNYWMQKYYYHENPDPRAAIANNSGAAKGVHYSQSAQWYFEYEFITQFINIASDYVCSSKEVLTGLLKGA